jgi:hypothetical protein
MNAERILVSHESIGDAQWFIRTASKYATERIVFDRPIGQNQGVQFPIARAYAAMKGAELMLRKAAALFEAQLPCGEDANIAKLLASEASWHAAEACMQTHGGFGYAREYDVERRWRESRIQQIAPISTNLVLANIAEHVLGIVKNPIRRAQSFHPVSKFTLDWVPSIWIHDPRTADRSWLLQPIITAGFRPQGGLGASTRWPAKLATSQKRKERLWADTRCRPFRGWPFATAIP